MLEHFKKKTKKGPHFYAHLCCFVILHNKNAPNQLKLLTLFFRKQHNFKDIVGLQDFSTILRCRFYFLYLRKGMRKNRGGLQHVVRSKRNDF